MATWVAVANHRVLKMGSSLGTYLLWCASAGTVLVAHPTSAQPQQHKSVFDVLPTVEPDDIEKTVNDLMRTGVAAYRKKNFEAAREAFAKAWDLRTHVDIASTLAEVEMRLGRYREAAGHWEYYLVHSAAEGDEARAQLAECRKHLSRVRLEVDPPEADLLIDGVANLTEHAPTGEIALWLDPGEHTFAARKGRDSVDFKASVLAGEEKTIRLSVPAPQLAAVAPAAVVAAPVPKPTPLQERDGASGVETRTVVVVSGAALTIVALGLGVYSELRAKAADNRRLELIDQARADLPPSVPTGTFCAPQPGVAGVPSQCPEISSKADEAFTFHNVRNGSFIASGALGVATVATYLLWPKAQRNAEQAGLVIAPLDVARSRGLQVRLSF